MFLQIGDLITNTAHISRIDLAVGEPADMVIITMADHDSPIVLRGEQSHQFNAWWQQSAKAWISIVKVQ